MISSSILSQRFIRNTLTTLTTASRTYVSRAHPAISSVSAYTIQDAVKQVLDDAYQRQIKRSEKWERNKEQRVAKGIEDKGPYRNQDETIELALNLNLDPRKPGQALRGSIPLPHGSGKKVSILVFTMDQDLIESNKDKSSSVIFGDTSLIQSIQSGEISVSSFDRCLATPDIVPSLSKIARVLGPRGLMPNAKLNTIQPVENIMDSVKQLKMGTVQYRTDKNGIIHAGIGKASFSLDNLLDNITVFMNEIQNVKPDSFGKGKKKKSGGGGSKGGSNKNAKYFLKAHLTATQGKGSLNVDLRTLDPTSSFFMSVPPP